MLTGYSDDIVNDVYVDATGLISFTGKTSQTGLPSSMTVGTLTPSGVLNALYLYGSQDTIGNGVSTGPTTKIHVVGQVALPYPNQLQTTPLPILQPLQPPSVAAFPNGINTGNQGMYQVQLYSHNVTPTIDNPGPQSITGLYLVIGEAEESPGNVSTGPGAPQFACIDISTGTDMFGMSAPLGTLEDPVNDYPDWAIISSQQQPRAVYYAWWPTNTGGQAQWISPYATPSGTPDSEMNYQQYPYPPREYKLTFTLQTPSTLVMSWTADNTGTLYLDGSQVQTSNFQNGLENFTANLTPGTHTLTVIVENWGQYTGLYVDGKICPLNPTPIDIGPRNNTSPPPGGSNTTTPGSSTGVTPNITNTTTQPCPCENTILQAVAAIGALMAAGMAGAFLIARRTR